MKLPYWEWMGKYTYLYQKLFGAIKQNIFGQQRWGFPEKSAPQNCIRYTHTNY